eukprot:13525391-Heterocapsa_arctica.AAC.1
MPHWQNTADANAHCRHAHSTSSKCGGRGPPFVAIHSYGNRLASRLVRSTGLSVLPIGLPAFAAA